jgi:MFS family permease
MDRMRSPSTVLAARLPFFYGYVMLLLSMLMQIGSSPGQTFAISPFKPALRASLSLSEFSVAFAYMLGTLFAAIPLAIVGPLSDRLGLRRVSIFVVVALSVTCWFARLATGFWTVTLLFFLLRFLGQGSMTLLSSNTTSMWFRRRIGRVSAILSVGTAVAFAWIPDVLKQSIESNGWEWTFQAVAVVVAVSLLPLMILLFRNRPEDLGLKLDGLVKVSPTEAALLSPTAKAEEVSRTLGEAMATKSYYIIGLAMAVWAMTGTGVVFNAFTLIEERGLPESTATNLFKLLSISMLILQLFGGVLSDFLKLNRLFGMGATLLLVGLVALAVDKTTFGVYGFSIFFGAGQGLLVSVSNAVWVRFYGREHLGSIRGWAWCATVAGSGLGPMIMGVFKDAYGSFDVALVTFSLIMLPLVAASYFIHPPKTTL